MIGQEVTGDIRRAEGSAMTSSWLTASGLEAILDALGTDSVVVEIAGLTNVEVNDRKGGKIGKQALWFVNKSAALLLNKTNSAALGAHLGWNAAQWKGAKVRLSLTNTNFGPGVKVSPPAAPAPAPPPAESIDEDEAPF